MKRLVTLGVILIVSGLGRYSVADDLINFDPMYEKMYSLFSSKCNSLTSSSKTECIPTAKQSSQKDFRDLSENIFYNKLAEMETDRLQCGKDLWQSMSTQKLYTRNGKQVNAIGAENSENARLMMDQFNDVLPDLQKIKDNLERIGRSYTKGASVTNLAAAKKAARTQTEKNDFDEKIAAAKIDDMLKEQEINMWLELYQARLGAIPNSENPLVRKFIEDRLSYSERTPKPVAVDEFQGLITEVMRGFDNSSSEIRKSKVGGNYQLSIETQARLSQEPSFIAKLTSESADNLPAIEKFQCAAKTKLKIKEGVELGATVASFAIPGGALVAAKAARTAWLLKSASAVGRAEETAKVLGWTATFTGGYQTANNILHKCGGEKTTMRGDCKLNPQIVTTEHKLSSCLWDGAMAALPGVAKAGAGFLATQLANKSSGISKFLEQMSASRKSVKAAVSETEQAAKVNLAGAVKAAESANAQSAESAIQAIRNKASPDVVGSFVRKLDETPNGEAARIKVAEALWGRPASEAEKKWILDSHKTHFGESGNLGATKVRQKVDAGDGRPATVSAAETRLLFKNYVLGTDNGQTAKMIYVASKDSNGNIDPSGKLVKLEVVGSPKTENGVTKYTVKNAEGKTVVVTEEQLANNAINTTPKKIDIPGSQYEGKSSLRLEKDGIVTDLTVVDFHVKDGKIMHTVVYERNGVSYRKEIEESQLAAMGVKAKPEVAGAQQTSPREPAPKKEDAKSPDAQSSDTARSTASNGSASSSWSEKVAATERPNYVNSYGVASQDISGKPVRVTVQFLNKNGVMETKEVDAIVTTAAKKNDFSGTMQVQVKFDTETNTIKGHPNQGKPDTEFQLVDIDSLKPGKAIPAPPPTVSVPTTLKRINPEVKQPTGAQVWNKDKPHDEQDFFVFHSRKEADKESLGILSDRRLDNGWQIEAEKMKTKADQAIRAQAKEPIKDFYARAKEDAFAKRPGSSQVFNGVYKNPGEANSPLINSARDVVKRQVTAQAKKEGLSDEALAQRLKDMDQWMTRYDNTVERTANIQKAEAALKEFKAAQSSLNAAANSSTNQAIMSQQSFEKMAQNLRDMMLNPEQRKDAEIALRKLRCSRNEWDLKSSYGFNLNCN